MTILPQTQKSSNTKNQLLRKDNSNNGKKNMQKKKPFFLARTPYLSMNCLWHFLEKRGKKREQKKILIKKE